MASHKLTLRFAGICTHFRNVVPAVPHRVVLPDATALRFGQLHLEWSRQDAAYYLLPHFPFLRTPKNVERLTVPGVMTDGYLQAGVRIQVANARSDGLTYVTFDETPSISEYVEQYIYSEDVVIGGRAACYFDVFGGSVRTEKLVPSGMTRVVIDIETDGPPRLLCTPFDQAARPVTLTVDTDELLVANLEVERGADDPPYDYLLHYLTARGGIPPRIRKPTPGMGLNPPMLTQESAARTLQALAGVAAAGRPSAEQLARLSPNDLTPSCSDSRYP